MRSGVFLRRSVVFMSKSGVTSAPQQLDMAGKPLSAKMAAQLLAWSSAATGEEEVTAHQAGIITTKYNEGADASSSSSSSLPQSSLGDGNGTTKEDAMKKKKEPLARSNRWIREDQLSSYFPLMDVTAIKGKPACIPIANATLKFYNLSQLPVQAGEEGPFSPISPEAAMNPSDASKKKETDGTASAVPVRAEGQQQGQQSQPIALAKNNRQFDMLGNLLPMNVSNQLLAASSSSNSGIDGGGVVDLSSSPAAAAPDAPLPSSPTSNRWIREDQVRQLYAAQLASDPSFSALLASAAVPVAIANGTVKFLNMSLLPRPTSSSSSSSLPTSRLTRPHENQQTAAAATVSTKWTRAKKNEDDNADDEISQRPPPIHALFGVEVSKEHRQRLWLEQDARGFTSSRYWVSKNHLIGFGTTIRPEELGRGVEMPRSWFRWNKSKNNWMLTIERAQQYQPNGSLRGVDMWYHAEQTCHPERFNESSCNGKLMGFCNMGGQAHSFRMQLIIRAHITMNNLPVDMVWTNADRISRSGLRILASAKPVPFQGNDTLVQLYGESMTTNPEKMKEIALKAMHSGRIPGDLRKRQIQKKMHRKKKEMEGDDDEKKKTLAMEMSLASEDAEAADYYEGDEEQKIPQEGTSPSPSEIIVPADEAE